MAGPVRQPIDLKKLEKYISKEAPEIQTPLVLKQVRNLPFRRMSFNLGN